MWLKNISHEKIRHISLKYHIICFSSAGLPVRLSCLSLSNGFMPFLLYNKYPALGATQAVKHLRSWK
jgi:hypothetical protein